MAKNKNVLGPIHRLRKALASEQMRTNTTLPKRAEALFKRLKSADYRAPDSQEHRKEMRKNGYRVRELHVKGTKGLIIKLAETENAENDIRTINRMIDLINKKFKEKGYTLVKPKGHAIGAFVGMKKINRPNALEIIGGKKPRSEELIPPTERGQKFLDELARKLNYNPDRLRYQLYLEATELKKHAEEVIQAQKLNPLYVNAFAQRNIIPVEYKKGHFVFMQILDLY